MANGVDPDQTAPIGAVCSGSMLFASILNLSVMLGNYLQQTTLADDIFRCIFFLAHKRVKPIKHYWKFAADVFKCCCCYIKSKGLEDKCKIHLPVGDSFEM